MDKFAVGHFHNWSHQIGDISGYTVDKVGCPIGGPVHTCATREEALAVCDSLNRIARNAAKGLYRRSR